MSAYDRIDLSLRSQAFFNAKIEKVHFLSLDKCLNSNFGQKCEHFLPEILEPFTYIPFDLNLDTAKFIHFLKLKDFDVHLPFSVTAFQKKANNHMVKIDYIYIPLSQISVDLLLFPSFVFNTKDRNESSINFDMGVDYLIDKNPLNLFPEKEWLIGWLLIFNFTAKQISVLTDMTLSYTEKLTKNVLEKSGIHDRKLYSKVARYIGWDNYIPSFFIRNAYIEIQPVYKNSPIHGLL